MIKIATLLIAALLTPIVSLAEKYDSAILRMHANILPRVVLMDYNYKKKLIEGVINITIIYEDEDYYDALNLENMIHERFPEAISGYPVHVITRLASTDSGTHSNDTTIFYFLSIEEKHLQNYIERADRENIITFCYDLKELKRGINLSTTISRTIKMIINMGTLKKNDVIFRPVMISSSEQFFD